MDSILYLPLQYYTKQLHHTKKSIVLDVVKSHAFALNSQHYRSFLLHSFAFSGMLYICKHTVCTLLHIGFFHLAICSLGSSALFCALKADFSSWLKNYPLYGYTTACLSIHLSIAWFLPVFCFLLFASSQFLTLINKAVTSISCRVLSGHFRSVQISRSVIAGSYRKTVLSFRRHNQTLFQSGHTFCIPRAMSEFLLFHILTSNWDCQGFLDFNYLNRYVMVPHWCLI